MSRQTGDIVLLNGDSDPVFAGMIREYGFTVTTPLTTDVVQGHLPTHADLVLIDGRGDAQSALDMVRMVGKASTDAGLARVVVLLRRDADRLSALIDAGIDYFLLAPFDEAELGAIVQLARRRALQGRSSHGAPAHFANRDPLTGLPDNLAAHDLIEQRQQQAGGRLAVMVVQVDHLSRVNDASGHDAGDMILREAGTRLERFARREFGLESVVARLGGSRFLVIAPIGVAKAALETEARALHNVLAEPFVDDPTGRIIVRLCATDIGLGMTIEDALRQAAGRVSRPAAARDGALVTSAIARNEIAIRYQPQYDAKSGRMVGVEALLRWQHPELGLLGAAALVTAAQAARMDRELTAHAHRVLLGEVSHWPHRLNHLRLSLNITTADLADPDFVIRLTGMLFSHGIATDRVTLEITESAMMHDPAEAAGRLAELRALGLAIAVDDFGTGYSSLAWLNQLPLDFVKIDSGLSRMVAGSDREQIVVKAVVDLANSLGLKVIAEGVESEDQLASLVEQGCHYFQGFLRSEPVDSDALARLVG